MSGKRPIRVLHITDTLGSGGVERLVWDIVRLSDPAQLKHRVVTFFTDGSPLPFVYAERLQMLGAYGQINDRPHARAPLSPGMQPASNGGSPVASQSSPATFGVPSSAPVSVFEGVRKPIGHVLDKLPAVLKRQLIRAWNKLLTSISSTWGWLRWKVWVHVPPSYRIFREYLRFRPDIIHAHGFYGFRYGLFFKKFFHRPMVHSVPCLISQMLHEANCPWLPRLYERHNAAVDRIFIADGYRDELLGLGVPGEKLRDIHGVLDLRAIDEQNVVRDRHRAEVRERLGLPANAKIALSVGRLNPVKGHKYSVEAMALILKQVPELHLVILGEGTEHAELEVLANELGVGDHVHFLGFVAEPLPFYAAADIYFRTPIFEGENLSSYPAIAMGLPVVGFDTACKTDLIGKTGHGLLVPNKDSAAFASAVISIISLPDGGQAMGQRGVEYCYRHLDILQEVETLTSTYASLHNGS
jgi:glycosyltransferase involved in cell wall biosynthesis